jgi:ABC-type transport system involved in multi-copper enzyme maturation permease subunit
MRSLLTIARTTMWETMRQSVYGLLLSSAGVLILTSPALAMFTFMDSTRLVQDMGLATILLMGLVLGVLGASNVLNREIKGRTALTVLSKPVGRPSFVLGKFLGLSAAIAVATVILTLMLILTYRFGVKDTASTKLNWAVMIGMIVSVLVALLIGLAWNYFLGRSFLTAAIWGYAAVLAVTFFFFCFQDKQGAFSGFGADMNWQIGVAAFLILEAVLILVAIAVAASTRTGPAVSLAVCFSIFLLGMLSEYLFGAAAETSVPARLAYAALPNLQVYWVTEGLIQRESYETALAAPSIPLSYVGLATTYTVCYVGAALSAALVLFERREVRE